MDQPTQGSAPTPQGLHDKIKEIGKIVPDWGKMAQRGVASGG
jgi:hypothetical protein